jgi:hypothetical protein
MVRVYTNHVALQEREPVLTKTPPSKPVGARWSR